MRHPGIASARNALLGGALAVLAGCGQSDTGTGPEPESHDPPLIRLFLASQESVVHGDWTQIQWKIDGATSAAITPGIGLLDHLTAGAKSIQPVHDVTYTLTATNAYGTVTAMASVTVTFRTGIYVDPASGDDANSGASPFEPLSTLQEALNRTQGGGTLFLAAGVYDTPLLIDGARRLVYGGLDPDTFLQEDGYDTWIRPPSGTPLVVRGPSTQVSLMDHVNFDARGGGDYAVDAADAPLQLLDCLVDGSWSATGTALRVAGTAEVTAERCRIRGGGELSGSPVPDEARGILVDDSATLRVRHSFVSGGAGRLHSSGVDVHTSGDVTLALDTIGARLASSASGVDAACVRIRAGRPALGGNLLFTRGPGKRPAVIEETADADPSSFEANMLVGVSQPAYDNFAGDGGDAQDDAGLNSYQLIIGVTGVGHVHDNRLQVLSPTEMLEDADHTDYHLLQPLRSGGTNPAVDGMPRVFDGAGYGLEARPVDIDGQVRPGTYEEYDTGADEL
jgi:hypothetical protein